jgi:hypothetical protein
MRLRNTTLNIIDEYKLHLKYYLHSLYVAVRYRRLL